ncbi:hypothetical protein JOD78_001488 [Herbaspirillum sp. 1130]|nr:hypothetical protein [Herbaspirillum sp. 1130]
MNENNSDGKTRPIDWLSALVAVLLFITIAGLLDGTF